jgi:transcriptional regulator with XRE-family HTH domain
MEMNINAALVKELRTKKAWSQEQLSTITDLNLRTIQRIENTGVCSLESRKALASAFEIDVSDFEISAITLKNKIQNNQKYGYFGSAVGLIFAYVGITYSIVNHHISYGEAGIYYGAIAAFVGVCCGLIGLLFRKTEPKLA